MLKEQMTNKIKDFTNMLISKENKGEYKNYSNKKKIENLVVFVVILIITIIIINTIWNNDSKKNKSSEVQENTNDKFAKTEQVYNEAVIENDENDLETKLEQILKKIEGVGNVKVLLTYSESGKTMALYNEDITQNDTEEQDSRRRK